MLEIDKAYVSAKNQIYANWGMNYISSTADVLKTVLGEDSKYYQAAFDIQKAYAAAQVALNAPETYSNVYKSASAIPYVGPYIAPVMATAAVALQAAQAAAVGNVSFNPTGYKSGGYTGNYGTSEVAGVVHGQEYVLNAEATKRVGINTLNAINNGADLQATRQAQANVKVQAANPQPIENKVNVAIFDDRQAMKDAMFGPDGEKAHLYHYKRNQSKLGAR